MQTQETKSTHESSSAPNTGAAPATRIRKPPVLRHIEISHYNEKARWALDYKQVPHVRKAPPPMLHVAWAYAKTGGKTFPVLELDGEQIGDSSRIIAALERAYPEPPLYPSDPEQRRRALELEDFFDEELGAHIRRLFFHSLTRDPAGFGEAAAPSAGRAVQFAFRVSTPVAAPFLRMWYGIKDETAEEGRAKTLAALDRIEAELQPSGYLVGASFSVADLAGAALLFPLVGPPEVQYRISRPLPQEFQEFQRSVAMRPGVEWVREMYRRHRGVSAAING